MGRTLGFGGALAFGVDLDPLKGCHPDAKECHEEADGVIHIHLFVYESMFTCIRNIQYLDIHIPGNPRPNKEWSLG